MENMAKQLAILNLTGELPQELGDYFARKGVKVIDPLVEQTRHEWTHVLTKDIHDFSLLRDTYKTLERDVKLISLSSVQDIQNFIASNGKLIFDELWMKGPLGEFILDKFFQEYAGIALGDNYPKFVEKGAFNVVNPFNTGEYLDRMVYAAFDHQVAALAVKTFFDHLNMYLAGLKNKNKVGFPIEVNYGVFDEIFGVQVHFYTKNLMIEDVTTCLSTGISRRPEENLLNISVQSADFFDFTYLSQVKKVVITGLWTRNEKIKVENRGLMFADLTSAGSISGYQTEGLTSTLTTDLELKDVSGKIVLPQQDKDETQIKISGENLNDLLAEKISSSIGLEKIKQIISGEFSDDKLSEVISGNIETQDGKIILESDDEMKDILNLVKGKVKEEKEIIKISGAKFNPDNFAYRIASGLAEKATDKDVIKVRSLGEKLPESIKSSLFDFAKKLNKQIEDLSDSDIENFENFSIPEIVKSHTVLSSTDSKKFLEQVRTKLEHGLKEEFGENSVLKIIEGVKTQEDEWKVKELLKSTLKTSLDDNFQLSHKESMTKEEQDLLVKSLSSSFNEKEDKIREIVNSEAIEGAIPLFQVAESGKEKELQSSLEKMNQENAQLKNNIKTLMTEVKILKETKLRMAEMQLKAKEAAKMANTESSVIDGDENLRTMLQQKLTQGGLNALDQEKLAGLLERETRLIALARDEEAKAKKIQIEASQKEVLFMQEIEKTNRQLKAKDLMLSKTREAMEKNIQKKDYELNDLKQKLDQVTRTLATGPSQAQAQNIKELEKQNQNLSKMLDVYKIKVSSLATNMQTKADDGHAKEEVRRLTMVNNQFKNKLEATNRELQKMLDKTVKDSTQIQSLRQEKANLENMLKKAGQENANKVQPVANNAELENNFKRAQSQIQNLEVQLREATTKLKDTETRYSELQKVQKPQTSAGDDASKGKLAQLEGNVKKLTHDLIESKNQLGEMKKETNKLRQEKTALQNQLDKLKKETEKSKPAGKKAA